MTNDNDPPVTITRNKQQLETAADVISELVSEAQYIQEIYSVVTYKTGESEVFTAGDIKGLSFSIQMLQRKVSAELDDQE